MSLHELISPHVQHRFAISRILRLIVFEIMGGWSPITNMYIQSFLPPVIFLLLTKIFESYLTSRLRKMIFYIVSCVVFLSPLSWEIVLLGFQSHFYFTIIFALLLIIYGTKMPTKSVILTYSILAFFNYFTSASSLLPLVVVFAMQVMFLLFLESWRQKQCYELFVLNLVFIFIAYLLMVTPSATEQLGVKGILNFITKCLEAFSWPMEFLGLVIIWFIPFLYVFIFYRLWKKSRIIDLLKKITINQQSMTMFALLLWIIANIASIVYARGNLALFPSRYLLLYSLTLYVPLIIYQVFFNGLEGVINKNLKKLWACGCVIVFIGLCIGVKKEFRRALEYKANMEIVRTNVIKASVEKNPGLLREQQKINPIYAGHPDPDKVYRIITEKLPEEMMLWLK